MRSECGNMKRKITSLIVLNLKREINDPHEESMWKHDTENNFPNRVEFGIAKELSR